MTVTPINAGEAIIEPFWAPELSGLRHWRITPGEGHGLRVWQNWCWVAFEWSRKPGDGPALRMSRSFGLNCSGYDKLMVSLAAPEKSVFRLIAETDKGQRTFVSPPCPPAKKEYLLDLDGASRLEKVTMEIEAVEDGVSTGWLNWLGLQNSRLLEAELSRWKRFDTAWQGYIKPEDYQPAYEPIHDFFLTAQELDTWRRRHPELTDRCWWDEHKSGFGFDGPHEPEQWIGEFVNFWGDTRYNRQRDHNRPLLMRGILGRGLVTCGRGADAALAGLLLRDKELLRLAARYAMAIGMCEKWDDGMICCFPGGTFEHRSFVQSLCAHEVAMILHLAGEMFTDLGREFLMRRLAEEALGSINFNTWKHEYIHHCNQLIWFTPGRMLAYLVLEKAWPRVEPYTEIAYREAIESLENSIEPDGGYVEGPSYFTCVGRHGGKALYYYARARNKAFDEVVPEAMKRTGDFAEVISSTATEQDVIPICDSSDRMDWDTLSVMAASLPGSAWTRMFRKAAARRGVGSAPMSALAFQLEAQIPPAGPEPQPFVFLGNMGTMASSRKLGTEFVKLLIMGNKAGAGHTHEDKGSFVLEFAGEAFAMDPGTCDYSSPISALLQRCHRHNMLVPTGVRAQPRPQSPLLVDVKPQGAGDEQGFHARIDATAGWEDYYGKWTREWLSPTPDVLTIRDEYELKQGDGVEFYWNTRLPVEMATDGFCVMGKRGRVAVTVSGECQLRLDELPLLGMTGEACQQHRVAVRKVGRSGCLEVRVKLLAL